MKTIIAIGGGHIGEPILDEKQSIIGFHPAETTSIDIEIIKLSGKKNPKVLFIPTASQDSAFYCKNIEQHYGNVLGCDVSVLLLAHNPPSKEHIQRKIQTADIIYVGGGNSDFMLKTWEKLGVDSLLEQAYNTGTILCGLSAGANCWFEHFSTDSFITKEHRQNPACLKDKVAILKGMNLLKGCFCPHYSQESYRQEALFAFVEKTGIKTYASDNNTACLFIDGVFQKALKSSDTAQVYQINLVENNVVKTPL